MLRWNMSERFTRNTFSYLRESSIERTGEVI
jgi:hypothetical protein